MAIIGARGWQGLVDSVGIVGATERLHRWRIENPTHLGKAVIATLEAMGYREGADYERDALVHDDPPLYGDMVFHRFRLILEVDGERWHTNSPLHGEDRLARDARKNELLHAAGWSVVHLPETLITGESTGLEAAVRSAIGQEK